ncbi:MAG: hypothetical protein KY395_07765, partial [Actinobacteria bacterium]|nr:hypothetical protein [Actinomycetota bacterium]
MTAEDHTVAAVDRWPCTITAAGGVMVSPFDLLWIFFILSGLQPPLQQRLLPAGPARRALEKRDHSRAITLIHRREKLAFLGSPSAGSSTSKARSRLTRHRNDRRRRAHRPCPSRPGWAYPRGRADRRRAGGAPRSRDGVRTQCAISGGT